MAVDGKTAAPQRGTLSCEDCRLNFPGYVLTVDLKCPRCGRTKTVWNEEGKPPWAPFKVDYLWTKPVVESGEDTMPDAPYTGDPETDVARGWAEPGARTSAHESTDESWREIEDDPYDVAGVDAGTEPDIRMLRRALSALALEVPAAVYDDFAPRVLALIAAYDELWERARVSPGTDHFTVADVSSLLTNAAHIEDSLATELAYRIVRMVAAPSAGTTDWKELCERLYHAAYDALFQPIGSTTLESRERERRGEVLIDTLRIVNRHRLADGNGADTQKETE